MVAMPPRLPSTQGLLDDVRGFLAGLAGELPELFSQRPQTPASRRATPDGGYREKARAQVAAQAAFWSARMGVTHGRIAIKDQRTLWGSCSRAGNLNFNWRLILAPPEILDYVVIHELAHRVHMNHSRRFWSLVQAHCPDYRARRRWLREHEHELRHGGVAAPLAPRQDLEKDEVPRPGGDPEPLLSLSHRF